MRLRDRYVSGLLFTAKADINGICVQLYTSNRDDIDAWRDNFYAASDKVRSHARLYSVKDPDEDVVVKYDPKSNTAIVFNVDYYGWIKSIALGLTGCLLESEHDIYSVHGAAIDIDGGATAIIAPSKMGKTTQSWGLLRSDKASLISDDWFFVTFGDGRPVITGSEKNCYVDADIGDVWEEYKPLISNVKFDEDGRGIANIRWVGGDSVVSDTSRLRHVIMLKRDCDDPELCRELSPHDALEFLMGFDFCNPHQILRDPFRQQLRASFFKRLFENCDVHLVNTTGTPQETQALVRGIAGVRRWVTSGRHQGDPRIRLTAGKTLFLNGGAMTPPGGGRSKV